MAMNRARRTSNLNNILTYDTLGNSTLIANLTVEGLTGAGFVKADAAGLLSVDTAAYTVTTGATNYLPKITAPNTLGQSLVYDNGTSVLVNTAVGVPGYSHAFQVMANGAGGLVVSTTDVASAIGIVNSSSANKTWDISPYGNHLVINESGIATRMKFDAGGNITIGDITNTGHKLEIVGSFRTTGTNTLSALQGVGDRMVVANTNGVLTTQAIPAGNITGTGAAGQVNFWTGTTTVSGSNNLFWDNANGRLGIGTNFLLTNLTVATTNARLEIAEISSSLLYIESLNTARAVSIELGLYSRALKVFTRPGSGSYTNNFTVTENGRLLLGSTSDNGQRLQVYGDTLLRGSGNTNATFALTVQNSDQTNIFRVRNDNFVFLQNIFPLSAASLGIYHRENIGSGIVFGPNAPTTLTSGTRYTVITNDNFLPTSGNSSYAAQLFQPTINQTGGANGITRGLYIIPTLTAAADWRSIQWDNNTGWGLYGAGTANNYLAGSLGIGTTSLSNINLRVTKTITGGATAYGQFIDGQIQSDVVTAIYIQSQASTQAASFTLTNLYHYLAGQGTFGAGSSVTNQFGFRVQSSLTGATNNYGFYGDIASGTGRWNLYMNGTAANYLAGTLQIGSTTSTGEALQVTGTAKITGATTIGGNVTIPVGSYDAPSLSFANDTNTGLFSPLADNLELKTGTNNAVILENQGTNLMQYSENLGTFPTNFQQVSVSIPGNVAAPDGTLTANIAVPDTSLNQHRFWRSMTLSQPHTVSVYAKSAGYNFISIAAGGGVQGETIIFDIANGTISGSAANHTATIENVGNGWFRCSLTPTSVLAPTTLSRWIIVRNANSTASYSGDGASGVYVWGWQIEENTASTSYIKTGATAVTRPQATTILGQNLYGNLITRRLTGPSQTDLSFATGFTDRMTIHATSGNVMINSSSDLGQRLQVIGDTLLRGSGNTSATIALTVQNSGGADLLRVRNDNSFFFSNTSIVNLYPTVDGTTASSGSGSVALVGGTGGFPSVFLGRQTAVTNTFAGTQELVRIIGNFTPTSGSHNFEQLRLQSTINQTGGANGITRGLYVNPTLTAATDWRSIQWDNNTGYGLYGEGTAPNLIKGNLIIGPSALNQAAADSSLHIGKAMNAQSSYGSTIRYEAQNGVIAAHALNISLSTQDAAFTISNIYGVSVIGTIKGASNTITNQYGFFVNSTFIGATNNYAYWGDVPAGANTWNLYMNGGANNYLAGSLGIGSNALTGYGFRNNKQLTGSSTSIGNGAEGQIQTGVSVAAYYYRTISNQIVGTSTTSIIHYGATQGTLSGVSNNQYGFYAFDLSVSTANYGFYGALTSGANKWNLYMSGTANNYMNGALLLGNTTTDGANKLQVTGSSALNGVTYVNTNASIAGYGHSLQVLANASGGMIVSTTNSASAIGIVNSASSNKTWDISPFNNDLSFNESGVGTRMYLSAGGRIGLGIAPVTLDNATVTIGGNVTTGTGPTALLISPTVQSTATSSAVYSLVRSSTQAASFVLPSLFYYFTSEGTFGAGSSVTSQYGYYANGNMTGATNNYGFYGGIPAGTGRWNLYMNGDAHNYLAGNVGIGSGGTNDLVKLYIVGSTTGTTIYNFAYAQPQINTSLSSGLFVFRSNVSGTGTASTTESITHFLAQQSSLGSATATNQYGFRVDTSLTGATNNYGFYGNIASAANRWNLYMAGTALNHLNGTTLIGTATDDGVNKLQVAGSIKATGILRSDITQAAVTNNVSISLLGSNITTYAAGFSMANAGYGLNGVYAQHEQRFGGNATFAHGNINGAGLMLNKLAPTAAGTVTITQQTGQLRTMSNLHLMTQFEGNNNLTVTDMSGLHIYGHYRTSGTGTLTVSNAYYGIFLADPNEFGTGATITGTNWGFYQQGTAPINAFQGSMLVGTTTTDANNRLVVSGNTRVTGNTTSAQFRLSALNTAPATSTSTGTTGEIVIDANHIYVCTATNTWKRVAIATF